ncbi:hypothetical protein F4827_003101 [Paraburkholderia bannensis]|uniref:Uncharacterized protein n=1 Tax=Paraburkholderia bannensis TaxID=765414 RepID=A0A7W9TXI8_9BURK|nr:MULTISPECIES: hypothetical protein [Paraburkholderia]MBB3258233.1 hypothetical protein [Paraburkholderia sp. WP4_3_2]MBB6103246.1 hypothetical protein [Paraburkholderia bannensis]
MPVVFDQYNILRVEASQAYIRKEEESAKFNGARKIVDCVFILDGKQYDVSFQQLKHALDVETETDHEIPGFPPSPELGGGIEVPAILTVQPRVLNPFEQSLAAPWPDPWTLPQR